MTEHPNVKIETLETGPVVPSTRFGIPIIDRAGDADLFRIWPEELLDREVTTSLAPTCHSKRWKTKIPAASIRLRHALNPARPSASRHLC